MRTKEGNKEKDILEAAVMVFAETGYHKAKISKIAEVANVATGSVYVYFKNKEDIILRIFEQLWTKLYIELDSLSKNQSLSPTEKIDSMIDLVIDMFTENPSLALVFVNEQNHLQQNNDNNFTNCYDKFLDAGEEVLREGIQTKLFDKNLDIKMFRHYIFGALRNMLHQWAKKTDEFPLSNMRRSVKLFTKYGIMNKE